MGTYYKHGSEAKVVQVAKLNVKDQWLLENARNSERVEMNQQNYDLDK
ncbi:10691_t:CDS:2, partial [Funneliformis mosseae]